MEMPVDDTTILIGENNSGKTALLEAIGKALPSAVGGRREPFDRYDHRMTTAAGTVVGPDEIIHTPTARVTVKAFVSDPAPPLGLVTVIV